MPKVSIIIPCYFNEGNIPVTTAELIQNEQLFPAGVEFEYIMVDDGSKDKTLDELVKFKDRYPDKVKVIKLAGNVGSFNAILAGMNYATGDCNVIITADLQDPPDLMPKMYDYWLKGIKFVIANRQDREEGFFSKLFANTYHALIRKFVLKNVPSGGFDYVLFDKQLREEVVKINERNTNTIYLLAWLNYDFVNIPYVRRQRKIGKSRWTVSKKMKLFIDSFVSFSFFPIRAISVMGIFLGIIAFMYGIFVIVAKFTGMVQLSGWSSMMVVFLFVSSFQMVALGILGEYVWRALDAARGRPNFIVEKVI
ncbi:MAG: glycosyltransferase family 2 protein [Bacteroidia bacterium]|jgi:dolichol-phosphate mannosyltransferase